MSSSWHSAWSKAQVMIVVQHMSEARATDSSSCTSREGDSAPDEASNLSAPIVRRALINTTIYVERITNKLRNQERVAEASHSINYGLRERWPVK